MVKINKVVATIEIEGAKGDVVHALNQLSIGRKPVHFPKIKMIKEIRNAFNCDLINGKCLAEELIRIIIAENPDIEVA